MRLVILILIFSSVAYAQIPVTIRDDTTLQEYNVLLLGYINHISATETDAGIDPFSSGSNIITYVGGTTPPLSDYNIDGLRTVEVVSDNFDILLSNNWMSGNGYSIAVEMSPTLDTLGEETGLGNPYVGTSVYYNYLDHLGNVRYPNRHYAVTAGLVSPLLTYLTPNLNEPINAIHSNPDFEGDIVAFETTYPFGVNSVSLIPSTGSCSPPTYPQQVVATAPIGGNIECVYLSRYIGYVDTSQFTFAVENSLPILPGSPSPLQFATGVFEGDPSVSINNGQQIAYYTNRLSPMTTNFDIEVYDVSSQSVLYTVPETNPSIPLVQVAPSYDYPWIAFVEGGVNFPVWTGQLHLYNVLTGARIPVPGAANVEVRNDARPKLYYDSTSQTGIVVYLDGFANSLGYAFFNPAGLAGVGSFALSPQLFFSGHIDIARVGGAFRIFYTESTGPQQKVVRARDVTPTAPGSSSLAYDPMGNILFDGFSVSGDGKFLGLLSVPPSPNQAVVHMINLQGCANPPCEIYEMGLMDRIVPNWPVVSYDNADRLLFNNRQSPIAIRFERFQISGFSLYNLG